MLVYFVCPLEEEHSYSLTRAFSYGPVSTYRNLLVQKGHSLTARMHRLGPVCPSMQSNYGLPFPCSSLLANLQTHYPHLSLIQLNYQAWEETKIHHKQCPATCTSVSIYVFVDRKNKHKRTLLIYYIHWMNCNNCMYTTSLYSIFNILQSRKINLSLKTV